MSLGRFHEDLHTLWLDDGRRVELTKAFNYTDPNGLLWSVPKKAIVDGASIPRILWTPLGGPFEGKYRKASVIHDFYCDRRSRAWEAVHRVFYDAMITSGVSGGQANLLYAGVYWGGPRWSETVVANARLRHPDDGPRGPRNRPLGVDFGDGDASEGPDRGIGIGLEPPDIDLDGGEETFETRTVVEQYALSPDALAKLGGAMAGKDLSLDEIERLVDQRTQRLEPHRVELGDGERYRPLKFDGDADTLKGLWSDLGLDDPS